MKSMWAMPPIIKVYEALGAVADKRTEVDGDAGKVYSSSRNKFYDVSFDNEKGAIMANDNGSFWIGYLGYPSIAYLMKIGVLGYSEDVGKLFKDIPWKDINVKFKNDFDKTMNYIFNGFTDEQKRSATDFAESVMEQIGRLNLTLLGNKTKPPQGY